MAKAVNIINLGFGSGTVIPGAHECIRTHTHTHTHTHTLCAVSCRVRGFRVLVNFYPRPCVCAHETPFLSLKQDRKRTDRESPKHRVPPLSALRPQDPKRRIPIFIFIMHMYVYGRSSDSTSFSPLPSLPRLHLAATAFSRCPLCWARSLQNIYNVRRAHTARFPFSRWNGKQTCVCVRTYKGPLTRTAAAAKPLGRRPSCRPDV